MPPSQQNRRKAKPKRQLGGGYAVVTYSGTIYRASREAGVTPWHPHQLRHTHRALVRKAFGLEAAQVSLGRASAKVNEIYPERNFGLAAEVAGKMG